jgi:hypothetical protein
MLFCHLQVLASDDAGDVYSPGRSKRHRLHLVDKERKLANIEQLPPHHLTEVYWLQSWRCGRISGEVVTAVALQAHCGRIAGEVVTAVMALRVHCR